jgi:signal peptidase II
MRRSSLSNSAVFWPLIVLLVAADRITKSIAENALTTGISRPVAGDWLQLTLVHNPGAAFGLNLGANSRWIFMALTVGALVILWRLYRATERGDIPRTLALSLVCAGAVGNLVDRIRSARGVVDFIDVGVGTARWPTFNVADMAVSVGAFLLAWVLWGEDRVAAPAPAAVTPESQKAP